VTVLGDILVLGLGSSGRAAARYCADLVGTEVDSLTVADSADTPALRALAEELSARGAVVALGTDSVWGRYDTCIASPGIPPHAPLMASAIEHSDQVISELEFAYARSSCPWVAVTGTNGKTTTTALLAHLLNAGGIPARAVGNIGTPAIEAVADCDESEVLVAEVSSFQLAFSKTFHPRAAVLLNITPDHIDWHGSFEAYASDKAKVFANLTPDDVAIVNVDDEGSAPYADAVERRGVQVVRVGSRDVVAGGATVLDGTMTLETRGGPVRLVGVDDLRIRGPHNVGNALAAAAAAHSLGISASDLRWGLKSFAPIEHRLEPVGEACGAEWFNDSKATNPDAVSKAIASFGDRPLLLLLGGRNKGNDFTSLAREVEAKGAQAVLFGEARPELASAFSATGVDFREADTLAEAVSLACDLSVEGGAVVLSPACASFDEFGSYAERGHAFKDLVASLNRSECS